MADKDFLSQFSDSNKPESFKEEERIPVVKERKKVSPVLLGIALALLLAVAVLLYFLFLAPKIAVPDFAGKNKSDVAAWVRQQGIETTGIVFDEIHDFDTDEGTVISQSISPGKKVRKDVKMNFVLSLGPDPEEAVKVPDLSSMTKAEVQQWISKYKLSKTKVVTAYSDSVEEDGVIDYSFSGCDEDSFTRACSLKINVSKGPAPAGKVTVEDFEKKPYETVEAWAKTKKIELTRTDAYSDKVEAGYVISQSVEAGKAINEGDTFHVVVSLGKAIFMPDMYEWTENQISAWCSKNGIVLSDVQYKYNEEFKGECIYQSIPAGTLVTQGDYLSVTISLDDPKISEFIRDHGEHATLKELEEWIADKNRNGAHLTLKVTHQLHDTIPMDCIIDMTRNVKNTDTVHVTVSDGKNILLKDKDSVISWDNVSTEEQIRELCEFNEISYEISYAKKEGLYNGDIISIIRTDTGVRPLAGTYISQKTVVEVVIADNGEEGIRP
ncbi:MAG: PASTA domain-containing protein [Erysipelotrichaceae bacterium]|nr:PASTA domain-containing protein [Erysipelotrichaceae bacterium]